MKNEAIKAIALRMVEHSMLRWFFCAVLACSTVVAQGQQRIVVGNPTDMQRHEVVEIDGVHCDDSLLIIRDAFGIEQPWQHTRDGNLLLYVSVRPHGEATYTLSQGRPARMRPYVFGKHYPQRADDISFENDRIGFRIYGPGTQQRGEKAYGYDLWVKHSPELLLDSLYRLEFSQHPQIRALRKAGRKHEADSIETLTSYHLDHGAGMDGYGVGPTLGCGVPALMVGDSLCMPWCYERYEILENGPLRFQVRLDFGETEVDGQRIREHRVLTLDRGSNFCRQQVWYDGIERPLRLAAGFAIRKQDTVSVVREADYMLYADPTIDPQRHNSQMYVGVVFPQGIDDTRVLPLPQPKGANVGHGIGVKNHYLGTPYIYYVGAAWSDYDVRSMEEWHCRAAHFRRALLAPLNINLF